MSLSTLVEKPSPAALTLPAAYSSCISSQQAEDGSSPLDIGLALAVERKGSSSSMNSPKFETIKVFQGETIKDIKLRLHNRGWFALNRHCLVFGDRAVMDHMTVGELVRASGRALPEYLHVLVRLSDVDTVDVKTLRREVSLSNLQESNPRGVVSRTISNTSLAHSLLAGPSLENGCAVVPLPPLRYSSASESTTIVHLMVHKSAKLDWRHHGEDMFDLTITASDTVESLKQRIGAVNCTFEVEEHDIVYKGQVLGSSRPLVSYGVGDGSTLELVPLGSGAMLPDGSPPLTSPAHKLHAKWQQAQAGLQHGQTPKLAAAGTGGSYFLQDVNGSNVAVFKPQDEEPLADNNPKGTGTSPNGEGYRRGTRPGEGAVREVAAYLLDHENFASVPATALVTCHVNGNLENSTKVGSLQEFVVADFDCEEMGTSAFPVKEVHKIAILDIRLANTDRNGGNILARKAGDSWELVPIDHGYCLPDTLEDISFEWLYWSQAQVPFSEEEFAYIERLDVEADLAILQAHKIHLREECKTVLHVCTMLLKKGACLGLSPYQIGCIMSRTGLTKSPLEKLHHHAMHLAMVEQHGTAWPSSKNVSEDIFLRQFGVVLDEFLEDFVLDGGEDLLI